MVAQVEKSMSDILDTIAKLKSLADRPGTPEEAAAAANKIQALMFRHNISQFQVNSATRDETAGYEKEMFDFGSAAVWKQSLLGVVCKFNFCKALIGNSGRTAYIVGRKHNATVSRELYMYLVGEIDRLADMGWEEYKGELQVDIIPSTFPIYVPRKQANARRWKTAFREGAVAAISYRLQLQFEKDKAAYAGSSSLVVTTESELNKAIREMFGRTKTVSSRNRSVDQSGFSAGHSAGKQINLAEQIGE